MESWGLRVLLGEYHQKRLIIKRRNKWLNRHCSTQAHGETNITPQECSESDQKNITKHQPNVGGTFVQQWPRYNHRQTLLRINQSSSPGKCDPFLVHMVIAPGLALTKSLAMHITIRIENSILEEDNESPNLSIPSPSHVLSEQVKERFACLLSCHTQRKLLQMVQQGSTLANGLCKCSPTRRKLAKWSDKPCSNSIAHKFSLFQIKKCVTVFHHSRQWIVWDLRTIES